MQHSQSSQALEASGFGSHHQQQQQQQQSRDVNMPVNGHLSSQGYANSTMMPPGHFVPTSNPYWPQMADASMGDPNQTAGMYHTQNGPLRNPIIDEIKSQHTSPANTPPMSRNTSLPPPVAGPMQTLDMPAPDYTTSAAALYAQANASGPMNNALPMNPTQPFYSIQGERDHSQPFARPESISRPYANDSPSRYSPPPPPGSHLWRHTGLPAVSPLVSAGNLSPSMDIGMQRIRDALPQSRTTTPERQNTAHHPSDQSLHPQSSLYFPPQNPFSSNTPGNQPDTRSRTQPQSRSSSATRLKPKSTSVPSSRMSSPDRRKHAVGMFSYSGTLSAANSRSGSPEFQHRRERGGGEPDAQGGRHNSNFVDLHAVGKALQADQLAGRAGLDVRNQEAPTSQPPTQSSTAVPKEDHRKRKRNRTIQSCLVCHQNKRKVRHLTRGLASTHSSSSLFASY